MNTRPPEPQLLEVATLPGQLHQFIGCIPTTSSGLAPQFLEIATLAGPLHQFIDSVRVTVSSPGSQLG